MSYNTYYNQILSHINSHINELKENYNLNNEDPDDLKYRKLIAHKLFTEQQAGKLEKWLKIIHYLL